jgi:hypothetical protein
MRPCSEEMLRAFDDPEFVSAYDKVMREFCKRQDEEHTRKQQAAAEGRTVTVIDHGVITYWSPEALEYEELYGQVAPNERT